MKKVKKKPAKKTAWILIFLIIAIIAAYWKRNWIKGLFVKNNESHIDREIDFNTNGESIINKSASNVAETYPIK